MIGAGHPLNIDGIGGGAAVTTKVAMLSHSDDDWAEVDYFFAQVGVEERLVDFRPTCGNILVGVGPAAIEMGLVAATGGATDVRIRAVNTGARVLAKVRTEGGAVVYDGDAAIDGVPGTAAPVELRFMDVVGGATGALFPTGARREAIDGIEVSCMDVAMPMAIARADAFGLTGYESAAELDGNRAFYDRMEPIRREAGRRMGLGDVSKSVTPKFGLLAPARDGGTAAARYFMPWNCHPSLAVTGSQCLGACLLCPGTVGEGLAGRRQAAGGRRPSWPVRVPGAAAAGASHGHVGGHARICRGRRLVRRDLGGAGPHGAQARRGRGLRSAPGLHDRRPEGGGTGSASGALRRG